MEDDNESQGGPAAEVPGAFVKPPGRLNATSARAMLEAQQASGESVGAFCDRVGVKMKCFERWRTRLGRQRNEAPIGSLTLRPAASPSEASTMALPSPPLGRLHV